MKTLWAHPLGRLGLIVLLFWTSVALLADLIAGSWPVVARYAGRYYLPALERYLVPLGWVRWPEELTMADGESIAWEWALWPLVPYGPESMDFAHAFASPLSAQAELGLRRRHWLGTDQLGRDVLAAIVHGSRLSLAIGFLATILAAVLGGVLGSVAGYWGDDRLRVRKGDLLVGLLWGAWLLWAFVVVRPHVSGWIWICAVFCWALSGIGVRFLLVRHLPWAAGPIRVPVDSLVLRLVELELSIPRLLLILALLALLPAGVGTVIVVVAIVSWTAVARYLRAELLRVRALPYIEAARSLGIPEFRILWRHALPNALGPVLVVLAFGVANAVLLESALSFLGLGVPADVLTWGRLLAEGRMALFAWWLTLLPGLSLFSLLLACIFIGEAWRDQLDPRLREQLISAEVG
nr:MAG: hypothetical protein KatS3mg041_1149 [Bacteroidota bacterium]